MFPKNKYESPQHIEILPSLQPKEASSTVLPTISPGTTPIHISIIAEKNPVRRGDNQSITVKVTDSNSKGVSGAEINGELKYPGDNYEKDFDGITDINGNFLYSWTIGEKGDLGNLVIDTEVTSPGYDAQSFTTSFEIISPSNSSVIVNAETNPPNQIISTQNDGFDLIAAGDYGCNGVTKDVINKMKERNPDLVLALGDLSEVKNPACFFDLFSDFEENDKLRITLGEHDTDSSDREDSSSRFSQYLSHFHLEQPFYSYDYRNVHFLAMSTGKDLLIPYKVGSPQYNFVINDLAQASGNKNTKWIIVYGYRPFYTSPTVHPGPMDLRDVYHPIFEKYGVDLVITAHNHNYQRTYPLKINGLDHSDPIVTDNNSSNYINPKAPIFVTVGTAGNELYDILAQKPFVATQFKRNGFLDIHISNNGTKLSGIFYDRIDDADDDNFTISKL